MATPPRESVPPITRLEDLVLRVDLSERASRWDRVLFVPFGPDPAQLAYLPAQERPTIEPYSFALEPDGSVWIMDPAKHRVVHLSASGAFLDEVGGFHALSRDIATYGPDLLAMRHYQFGRLDRIEPDGTVSRYSLKLDGHSLYVSDILPTEQGLVIRSSGYTRPVASGPMGYFEVTLDKPVPRLTPLPGAPLGRDRWVAIEGTGEQDFSVEFISPQGRTQQPVHVELIDPPGTGPTLLKGLVGAGLATVTDDNVAFYLKVVAYLPDGSQVGARYLLQMGDSPMLFERLPDPNGVSDDTQWRHLLFGPDGALYLMQTDHDGITIYRRPG